MKRRIITTLSILIIIAFGGIMFAHFRKQTPQPDEPREKIISLPPPARVSDTSLESALWERRSIREYQDEELSMTEVSQLLWSAQGINRPPKYRTVPSAGALYPLEIYLLVGMVDDLSPGLYRYRPHNHDLEQIFPGDKRSQLSSAALNQEMVEEAPAVIIITAVYERTTVKYGDRGIQYVHMEVGSAAQNVYLQAASLNLGTVFIGAFHDEQVKNTLDLPNDETPLAILPIGRR
jgi:SagB-type dehydrogenase family enzyme